MPNRLSLRTAVLAAVAAGAVLVPSAAFADSAPSPSAPSVERSDLSAAAGKSGTTPAKRAQPSAVPRGGVAAGDRPAPAVAREGKGDPKASPVPAPRGGVAAGERTVGTSASGDSTATIAGSAAAALLLAGAGTVVLRRRSAAQRNG
ncbi:hypothetical protein [Streptomyces sp. NPDC056255]|uniref:hypothetical protein n=1 Tax=Streptomyces sp. NPDC056255 TaxID=3345764 RepID=UPI0035E37768